MEWPSVQGVESMVLAVVLWGGDVVGAVSIVNIGVL